MNFKFKSLAIALLAVSSVSANAAIDANNGNSELVFSAWDSVNGKGYTFDLDTSLLLENFIGADSATVNSSNNTTMLAGASLSSSFINASTGIFYDSALTGFNSAFTSTTDIEWNLNAADTNGRTRLMTTVDNSLTPIAGSGNNGVKSSANGIIAYYAAADGLATAVTGVDSYTTSVVADGSGYAGNLGNNYANFINVDTTNTLGSQSFLYLYAPTTLASSNATSLFKQLTSDAGANIFAKTYQSNSGEWRLQLGTVLAATDPVAAVPEPESYAMMLAGLALLGGVARRRKNNA